MYAETIRIRRNPEGLKIQNSRIAGHPEAIQYWPSKLTHYLKIGGLMAPWGRAADAP